MLSQPVYCLNQCHSLDPAPHLYPQITPLCVYSELVFFFLYLNLNPWLMLKGHDHDLVCSMWCSTWIRFLKKKRRRRCFRMQWTCKWIRPNPGLTVRLLTTISHQSLFEAKGRSCESSARWLVSLISLTLMCRLYLKSLWDTVFGNQNDSVSLKDTLEQEQVSGRVCWLLQCSWGQTDQVCLFVLCLFCERLQNKWTKVQQPGKSVRSQTDRILCQTVKCWS